MVVIAANLRPQILFMPIVKKKAVIIRGLAQGPTVERFVQDENSQAIAKVELFRRGHVVARSQGVDSHFLQDFELPLRRPQMKRRPQSAQVMMQAYAFELNALAVEKKAVVGIELDGADAKNGFNLVDHAPTYCDGRDGRVEIRMLAAPQLGVIHLDLSS